MGWSFTKGATKADIIAEVTREQRRQPAFEWSNAEQRSVPCGYDFTHKTLHKAVKGNVLWTVEELVRYKEPVESAKFIGCYLLKVSKGEAGYKPMDEAMHPYYYSCPLGYLDMVPEANSAWREKVLEYHAGRQRKAEEPTARPQDPKNARNNSMNQYERNYQRLTELLPEGRDHIRIDNNEPYLPLVVERVWGNQISLCHYGEHNGDAMRDPEVVFLVNDTEHSARPVYFRNDWVGAEHATVPNLFGDVPVKPHLQRDLNRFVSTWWQNIHEQQFVEAAKKLHQPNQESAGQAPQEPATKHALNSQETEHQDLSVPVPTEEVHKDEVQEAAAKERASATKPTVLKDTNLTEDLSLEVQAAEQGVPVEAETKAADEETTMGTEKERLIREAFAIAHEIGSRGFVARWLVDKDARREWPDPALRERELRAFWDEHWKESYPALVKETATLSLAELSAYRSRLQAQLAGTSAVRELFDHYAAVGAERRAKTELAFKAVEEPDHQTPGRIPGKHPSQERSTPMSAPEAMVAPEGLTNNNERRADRKERRDGEHNGAREGGSRNKPVKLERGLLRAFLWDHGPDREPSATFNRIYKHTDEWKYTQSFRPIDLGDLAQLVHDVEQNIERARAKEGNRSADNKERKRGNDQEQDR
jgi:hypothetical protein